MRSSLSARTIASMAACLLMVPTGTATASAARDWESWESKVSPAVLEHSPQEVRSFLVFLRVQADLSGVSQFDLDLSWQGLRATKEERGRYVFDELKETQERSQEPIVRELERANVRYQQFWIANMILVHGDAMVVERMAQRSDVGYVFDDSPITVRAASPEAALRAVEWNITKVRADKVWADFGVLGDGAVVGMIDSGVAWEHPALKEHYRGWDGATADHDYNWHDALHSGGDAPCGINLTVPCDSWGHGTGVIGVMIGDDGSGNQIGAAPGAKWMACRGYSTGGALGHLSTITECLQWMLAPTDLAGTNPDPSKSPHVINNSWGCAPAFGCADPLVLLPVVQSLRAAGIVVVHSAGNTGSQCETIVDPPKIYDEVITVGGTIELQDNIYPPSSRGPAAFTGLLKPDVVAPAASIRTTALGTGYTSWSGTSFAAPHVAGEVALLISGFPELAGNVGIIEDLIFHNTKQKTTQTENCGGVPGTEVPNNTYGWGRINCFQAHQAAQTAVAAPLTDTGSTFELLASVPNPSTGRTAIRFNLNRSGNVHLAVYDTAGRKVRVLKNAPMNPGPHSIAWDGRDDRGRPVASGAYFYRLVTDGGEQAANNLVILR